MLFLSELPWQHKSFDLVILVGRAGGFASAIRADELGAKTLMINAGLPLGGTYMLVVSHPKDYILDKAVVRIKL